MGLHRSDHLVMGLMAVVVVACAHRPPAGSDGPIRLHPENPRYFSWRGKPRVLIGASESYCAVANSAFDYRTYLDTIAADGSNLTRLMTGILVEGSQGRSSMGVPKGKLLPPWKRSDIPGYAGGGNKFDLTRWDPAYFERLRDFVAEAGKRGIVVNLVIFSPLFNETHWRLSPFNPANNVNGIDAALLPHGIASLDRHGGLLPFQEALVGKLVIELRPFDNVIYELNYTRAMDHMTLEWERHILEVLVRAQQDVGDRKLVAVNLRRGNQPNPEVDPRISVVNHINAPVAVVATHVGSKRAVGQGEVHRELLSDPFARMRAWEFVLAGAGLYAQVDISFGAADPRGKRTWPGMVLSGGGPAQRRALRVLSEFMSTIDYVKMRPAPDLLVEPLPDGILSQVLARPGEAYVVYARIPAPDLTKARITEPNGSPGFDTAIVTSLIPRPTTRTLSVRLDVAPGSYRVDWITPVTGAVAASNAVDHAGGVMSLEAPPFSEDTAVRIVRR